MTTHKINIGQGAARILRDVISGTGWAKTTAHIVIGGGLMVRFPELAEPPSKKDTTKAEIEAWAKVQVPEFEISEKEREACKLAIEHFAAQGGIPITPYSAELMKAFGFE